MLLSDLHFDYPSELVATEPQKPPRVAHWTDGKFQELHFNNLLEQFESGDLLILNESKVIPARLFTSDQIEFLFLREQSENLWEVLFPARDHKIGEQFALPEGVVLELKAKGLPQLVSTSEKLVPDYFFRNGEMALPPYIQEARKQRHQNRQDNEWYQTAWARTPGSVAAPTASLHFGAKDLEFLRQKGVGIRHVILHVGAGTFLPIRVENLNQHEMHRELVEVPADLMREIAQAKKSGKRVWALGTTVTRALESAAAGKLTLEGEVFKGETDLFIRPPFEFQVVDVLMTNFHQPGSTLLCLVATFAGLENVKRVYQWAIEKRFRLFSYGDLSVWS